MSVSCKVISARFVQQWCIRKVNESMNNFVEITNFEKFPPFRELGYLQRTQHVTVRNIPTFGTDPSCKRLYRFKL